MMKKILVLLMMMGLMTSGVFTAAPVLDSVGFEYSTSTTNGVNWSSFTALSMTGDGKYILNIDGSSGTLYQIRFNGSTVLSGHPLTPEVAALNLNSSTVSDKDLIEYYILSTKTGDYLDYLIDAVQGTKPFAYIKGNDSTPDLLDAAQYNLSNQKTEIGMIIPGDYPDGEFIVKGDLTNGYGNISVEFTLIISGGQTEITGDLADIISISVTPLSLNFGIIPRGNPITKAGDDIVINASSSETESDNVYVYMEVVGDDKVFYESLLELDDGGFKNILNISSLIIGEDTSETYQTRLHGDTTIQSAGPKEATIIYTAYGEEL